MRLENLASQKLTFGEILARLDNLADQKLGEILVEISARSDNLAGQKLAEILEGRRK